MNFGRSSRQKASNDLASLNVDDDGSVTDAVDKVLAENGCIDILVNNAGISTGGGSVEEVPIGAFRQVMETNFFGGLRCIKAVTPSMRGAAMVAS